MWGVVYAVMDTIYVVTVHGTYGVVAAAVQGRMDFLSVNQDSGLQLHTLEDHDSPGILFFQDLKLSEVSVGVADLTGIVVVVGSPVAGKTNGLETRAFGGPDHVFHGVFSVAVGAVCVQVRYGCHACILSSVGYLFQYYHGDNI